MTAESNETIIPKTEETRARLRAITDLLAPIVRSKEEVEAIAVTIRDFTEQAIRDDRARTAEDIKALAEGDLAVHFVLTEVIPVVTREPFRG